MADDTKKSVTITGNAGVLFGSMTKKKGGKKGGIPIVVSEKSEETPKKVEHPAVLQIRLPDKQSIASIAPDIPGAIEQKDCKKFIVELQKTKKRKSFLKPRGYKINKGGDGICDNKQICQTRKNRKITIGVSSLHKKMTRVKKIKDIIKNMQLQKLKTILVKHGLIKETSRAPESVIRQIAIDSKIIEEKGL